MSSIIVRHGANSYNDQGPIAILGTNKAAKLLVESGKIELYNGQYLEIVPLSSLSSADRIYVEQILQLITTLKCCARKVEAWELNEFDGGSYDFTGKCWECSRD